MRIGPESRLILNNQLAIMAALAAISPSEEASRLRRCIDSTATVIITSDKVIDFDRNAGR